MTGPATLPAGLEHQFTPALPTPAPGDRCLVWLGGSVHEASVERRAVIRHAAGHEVPGLMVRLPWMRAVVPADRVTRMTRLQTIWVGP